MTRSSRMMTFGVAVCVLMASLAWPQSSIAQSEGLGSTSGTPSFIGSASCATSTCHGNVVGQGPAWNHSLSTWLAGDPHAGSGALLRYERSRQMVHRLSPAAASSAEAYDNVLRTRCISCHATPTPADCEPVGLIDEPLLDAGVSCEGCHGAAEKWLDDHVLLSFSGQSRFAPETGMRDTESIVGRNETCVRCHIGSRSDDGLVREVNHDLIAAGHPALRFDLLIYNDNLPHHWDDHSDVEKEFGRSAVRTRRIGRLANLSSAASLSAQRAAARMAGDEVPWPEFADYDCFACHQSLSMAEYDLPPRGRTKSPLHVSDGLPVWNSWHSVGQIELRENPQAMKLLTPQHSVPETVVRIGQSLSEKYQRLATALAAETIDDDLAMARSAVGSVRDSLGSSPPVDWHEAAIQHLELDAALRDFASADQQSPMTQVVGQAVEVSARWLRFDRDQPAESKSMFDSPIWFDPQLYRDAVLKILKPQP